MRDRPARPTRLGSVRHGSVRPGSALAAPSLIAVLAATLLSAGCSAAAAGAPLDVAGARVAATGLDPRALLDSLPAAVTPGWQRTDGDGAVAVTLDDVRLADGDRAQRYAEAGFEAGARLSLDRGADEHLAIMVDRFPHPAAAHQVEDWHLSSTGVAMDDGVSLVGETAEGVLVIEDLLVRVVQVGEEADPVVVRGVLAAIRDEVLPRGAE